MPAPKGNKNAAKSGTSKLYRLRGSEEDHTYWSLLTPEQRAVALNGYIMWMESDDYESHSYEEWLEKYL